MSNNNNKKRGLELKQNLSYEIFDEKTGEFLGTALQRTLPKEYWEAWDVITDDSIFVATLQEVIDYFETKGG